MASEIRRVARAYWLQTPNFWFPMEPHFAVPGWQWMPRRLRTRLLMHFALGNRGRCCQPERSERLVDEIRLMTGRELRELFPGATLLPERFLGLTKSWVVHHGFRTSVVPRYDSRHRPRPGLTVAAA